MNRRLALYVDRDFMMAGLKPYDTFMPVNVKGYARVPLYFFADPTANKIYYGERYRSEFEDGTPNTYGDFLHSILDERLTYRVFHYTVPVVELLKVVMDDLRREYLTMLGELTQSLDPTARIPISIVWSEQVGEPSRKVFAGYLQRIGYEVDEIPYVSAEMFTLSLYAAQQIMPSVHKRLVIMEAFNEDLNYSLVQGYNAASVERTAGQTYPLLGVDSRVNVISTYTVNYVNSRRRLLGNKEELDKEYRRHFRLAREWTKQLDADSRPFMEVKTDFAVERGVENKVVLKKDEVEQLVTFHIRHLSQSFELFLEKEGQRSEDIDKIIMIGESLRSSAELRREMERFGPEKLLIVDARQEYGMLDGLFLRKQYQEKPDTAPKPPPPNGTDAYPVSGTPPPAQFEPVLIAAQLPIGAQLELGWNDRLIRALHIGNSLFVVLQHHLSQIVTGDQFTIDTFLLGQKPVFRNVLRGGKQLGDYTPGGPLNVLKRI